MNNLLVENRRAMAVFLFVFCLSAFAEGLLSSKPHQQVVVARDYKRSSSTWDIPPYLHPRLDALLLQSTASENEVEEKPVADKPVEARTCFWKPKAAKSWWKDRVNLKDLEVGQKLTGHLVQELIVGTKTGPKLFFECGVGRTNGKGDWSIVNGMLRMPRGKISVAKKRAARYRKRDAVDLYVSRVQTACGQLEVCTSLEEAEMNKNREKKVSVSSLEPGQEVRGTIMKVLPYGAFVDVGANRLGLLHIQKVADLFRTFIDKEQGMKKFGVEPKAKVRLVVLSVDKRRLALDFTADVKKEAEEERQEKKEKWLQAKKERQEKWFQDRKEKQEKWIQLKNEKKARKAGVTSNESTTAAGNTSNESTTADTSSSSQGGPQMSAEELAQWAEYAQGEVSQTADPTEAQHDEDEEEEEDDEDRKIEDAMGLGFY
jgi:predicted RNA-binding protein with RPS1 domain